MDGFTASLIVVAYRALIPLTMLRWPLAGYLLSMLADASDAMLLESATSWGLFSGSVGYSHWDKGLDLWYLTMGLIAVRKFWKESPLAQKTAHWLYGWRLAGVVAYFFWPHRIVFLFAPSVFENFYLAYSAIRKWWPRWLLTGKRLTIILLAVGIPKIAQEYLMHYRFVDQTWNFFRDHVFWWLY